MISLLYANCCLEPAYARTRDWVTSTMPATLPSNELVDEGGAGFAPVPAIAGSAVVSATVAATNTVTLTLNFVRLTEVLLLWRRQRPWRVGSAPISSRAAAVRDRHRRLRDDAWS